jgi:formylglycine-generating enzyme
MKIFILTISLVMACQTLFGQSIENVVFRQTDDDKIVVTFDLLSEEGQTFDVKLVISDDGGRNFLIVPRSVSGDVGPDVKNGRNKEIYWDVLNDMRRLEGEQFVIKVSAKNQGNVIFSGLEFVRIPGGTFDMGDSFSDGDPDEKPLHRITLPDYYMGKTEVTVAQFNKFVQVTNYVTEAEKQGRANTYNGVSWVPTNGANWRNPGFTQNDNHPVTVISWNDAVAFCEWAGCRLPTEAEWEYAARNAGQSIKYCWGNGNPVGRIGGNVADRSAQRLFNTMFIFNDYDDGYIYTAPVANFNANELGLFDMTGNVWEWCQDWYESGYYGSSPSLNPQGPSTGVHHVMRGGSWVNEAWDCRVTLRKGTSPNNLDNATGMRVVKSVE